jgi:putative phage-type endonuclease
MAGTPATDPEVRRTGLGGSDAAKALGVSPFGGRMDLYLEKQGQSAPLLETEAMRWGNILEDPIAREYARRSGRRVRRAADTLRHPVYPFLYAHIDRWSEKKGTPRRGLECKTAGVFTAQDFGEPGTDQVPDYYHVQCDHYMAVTGASSWDLAVLIGGQRFAVYTIARDEELIEELVRQEVEFWNNHVVPGIPPTIDGSEGSTRFLNRIKDEGTEHPMTDELEELALQYEAIRVALKNGEEKRQEVRNLIANVMGTDRFAQKGDIKVVLSQQQGRSSVDWGAVVAAAHVPPELVKEHTTRGDPIRRLTVTVKPA